MLSSSVKMPVPDEMLEEVSLKIKDYALLSGVAIRTKERPTSSDWVNPAPLTLLPSPFPRRLFTVAKQMQPHMNLLIHRAVLGDKHFLSTHLGGIRDNFTEKLLDIYKTVEAEGLAQVYHLGIIRTDYMVDLGMASGLEERDTVTASIKQVEFNTIASSWAYMSTKMTPVHRCILNCVNEGKDTNNIANAIPENLALPNIAMGMAEAYDIYKNSSAVVLMVVESGGASRNIMDQRGLEMELLRLRPQCRVLRRSIQELTESASLGRDKQLLLPLMKTRGSESVEVALVYYRVGYSPDDYESDKDWATRLLIERSRAIKCPSIHYHLATTKKFQEVVSRREVVLQFLKDPEVADVLSATFAKQLTLDAPGAMELAVGSPEKFVLKPQREGGGNNYFGQEVKRKAEELGASDEAKSYILMELITAPRHLNYLIKPQAPESSQGLPSPAEVCSELGVYGVILGSNEDIKINSVAGHLLRSKPCAESECGVSAGFGCIDTPYLF